MLAGHFSSPGVHAWETEYDQISEASFRRLGLGFSKDSFLKALAPQMGLKRLALFKNQGVNAWASGKPQRSFSKMRMNCEQIPLDSPHPG